MNALLLSLAMSVIPYTQQDVIEAPRTDAPSAIAPVDIYSTEGK